MYSYNSINLFLVIVELLYLFAKSTGQPSQSYVQAQLVSGYERRNYSECGVHPNNIGAMPLLKIIGGRSSSVARWPWVVEIYSRNGQLGWGACVGTLIHRRYVLTVASCINTDVSHLGVIVGKGLNSSFNFQEKRIRVQRAFVPPGFRYGFSDNDVAVLLLEEPVNFTASVRPACLPEYGIDTDNAESNDSIVGQNCTVLGWGLTRAYDLSSLSSTLNEVKVPVYSDEQCYNATKGFFLPDRTFFCAGGRPGEGTCEGDGGGPLLCLHSDEKYYLHGMVTAGLGCGIAGLPDFYTDVGHSRINGWIRGLLS